jgi:hypothetical protein
VCGADSASLYLEVREVTEHDVICEAKNDAELDGLLTVFHSERSSDEVHNVQVGHGTWQRWPCSAPIRQPGLPHSWGMQL